MESYIIPTTIVSNYIFSGKYYKQFHTKMFILTGNQILIKGKLEHSNRSDIYSNSKINTLNPG